MRVSSADLAAGRIRPAHGGDAPALARVHVDSWQASYADIIPPEELRNTSYARSVDRFVRDLGGRPATGRMYLIEDERGVYGYATIGRQPVRRIRFAGEIFELYVHPSRWREGAGRRLLTHAIWKLVEHRLNPVLLWVLTENVRARRFYEACGARMLARAPIQLGEKATTKLAYGWDLVLPFPIS